MSRVVRAVRRSFGRCVRCAGDGRRKSALHRADGAAPAHRGCGSSPAVRAPTVARSLLQGFRVGTAMSAAAAAGAVFIVVRSDQDQQILGDVASAHLRSLQADHLTDVLSSDQHTVKPWFNGGLTFAAGG